MKRAFLIGLIATWVNLPVYGADVDPIRVLEPGKLPSDSRLGKPKTLDDYFPMTPPANREAWEARRQELREQVLVATGLWPLPAKAPLKPTIHGKIDRDEYTIEKVTFASYPDHYVCGNLYRPKGKAGKLPGVLCPHGHWLNGRFYDAGEKNAKAQIDQGAEKTMEGARYPLQARCAMLARMGCVVFHYDMVGYADSNQIPHREGFTDVEAELRLQSFMGLQTYNSIRALDFLLSLPEVDPKRIGVTGASGGGTQTFILCSIDDRPTVAFPAVMVSTAMQGGCVCENCSYLRQFTGNVELAAVFAPKPLGMSGANDWTIAIEQKGLPELKALYKLYGAEERVMAKCFPQFGHNYNQVSRELMYNWFNEHLQLGWPQPVVEKPFVPAPRAELTVYDELHPGPGDGTDAPTLRKYLSDSSDKQIASLLPKDQPSLKEFQRVIGTALRVMIADRLPRSEEVVVQEVSSPGQREGVSWQKLLLARTGSAEQIPVLSLKGPDCDGTVALWIHPAGKASVAKDGKLVSAARRLLDQKSAIFAVDVFMTGEFRGANLPVIDPKYAGFTFGYNRPLLANRVHDILTALAHIRGLSWAKKIHLVGLEEAGPWVLLARGLCGDAVDRTAADFNQFRFDKVQTINDEMMLPGAIKYGGLPALAALAAPHPLFVHNDRGTESGHWLTPVYTAAQAPHNLQCSSEKVTAENVVQWLLR